MKRFFFMALSIILLVTIMPTAYAAESEALTFTVGTAIKEQGDNVDIPVYVTNNTDDLTAFTVEVSFDSESLEWRNLGKYDPNVLSTHPWTLGMMPLAMNIAPASISENSVRLNFMDVVGISKETGLLLTLRLRVKDNAPVSSADIFLSFESDVGTNSGVLSINQFNNVAGYVTVFESPSLSDTGGLFDDTEMPISPEITTSSALSNEETGMLSEHAFSVP